MSETRKQFLDRVASTHRSEAARRLAKRLGEKPQSTRIMRLYEKYRRQGMPAKSAFEYAKRIAEGDKFEWKNDEVIELERDGLKIVCAIRPDEYDASWLGEFTDDWSPEVLKNSTDPGEYRYFLPASSYADRRQGWSRCGYSRSEAHEAAQRQLREDMKYAREYEEWMLVISVLHSATGVELAKIHYGIGNLSDDLYEARAWVEDCLDENLPDVISEAMANITTIAQGV